MARPTPSRAGRAGRLKNWATVHRGGGGGKPLDPQSKLGTVRPRFGALRQSAADNAHISRGNFLISSSHQGDNSMDFSAISAEALGRLVGVSGRRVRQLAEEGRIPRANVDGRYDAPAVIRHLLAEARASRPEGRLELARAKALEVKTAGEEQRLAERRRELVAVDVATDVIDRMLGAVVAELVGLPARATRDVALRRKLEEEIHAARERMAKALAEAAAAIRAGREPDEVEDDEADG